MTPNPSLNRRPTTAGTVSLVRSPWGIIAYQAYSAYLRGRRQLERQASEPIPLRIATIADNMNNAATWPDDADGDVFRALESKGFDFEAEYSIDFNVDFEDWPPHPDALTWLRSRYSSVEVFEPQDDFNGYVHFKVQSKLSYTLVTDTQAEVTAHLERFGGVCETWGVLHQPLSQRVEATVRHALAHHAEA